MQADAPGSGATHAAAQLSCAPRVLRAHPHVCSRTRRVPAPTRSAEALMGFFFFLPERLNERPSFANMLESMAYLWAVINLSVSRVLMDLVQIDQNVYSRNGNIVFFSKRWRCLFPAGGLRCLRPAELLMGAGAESEGLPVVAVTARHFFFGQFSSPIDAKRALCV